MARNLNATTTTPWPAGLLPGVLTDQIVSHHYTLQIANQDGWASAGTAAPPWLTAASRDVVIDIDATRNPVATLRATVQVEGHDLFASWSPQYIRHVRVLAGWTADAQHPIMYGYLTNVTRRDGQYQIEAKSVDAIWAERPMFDDYQVPAGAISMAGLGLPGWGDNLRFTNIGIDTPTSPQLAEFRAQKAAENDSMDDFARNAAGCLNQTLRGIYRTFVPLLGPQYHALGPITSRVRLTLPAITDLEQTKDVETVAVYVLATATWTDAGTSKTETLMVAPEGGVSADWQTPKTVSLRMRPAASGLYDSRRVFQQHLRPTGVTRHTFTTRALWWLDPDQGLTIPTPSGNANVNIERIQYHVDAGTMTITATN